MNRSFFFRFHSKKKSAFFRIKEEAFWCNYFYRVSLIKQAAQLKALASENGIILS